MSRLTKNKTRTKQVVIAGLQNNGLGVVRALGRQGVPVIAVDGDSNAMGSVTKYCQKVWCDDFTGDELIDTLCKIGETLPEKGILFLTMDRSVLLVSEHRERLEEYYLFNMPDKETVDLLMNKGAFKEFAISNGFPMPKTYNIIDLASLDECAQSINYPCILKPQVKTREFIANTPAKAFKVENADELISTYRLISQWEKGAVVQEWIPGPDSNLIFCLYYFNANSEPIAWFTGRKLRQYIPYCGTACIAEGYHDDFVRDDGIRLFRKVNYRGFGAIEYKKDERDGSYKLIEPTVGRTEHLFALAAASGVNIPYIAYCDLVGIEYRCNCSNPKKMKYIYWKRDFQAAKHYMKTGELTVWEWLMSLCGKKEYALFAWDDLGPIKHRITENLSKGFRKIGRFSKKVLHKSVKGLFLLTSPRYFRANYEIMRDFLRRKYPVLDNDTHIIAALDWLASAQDAGVDDGVSRGYCIKSEGFWQEGWQLSYPETTGYIIPTLFNCYHRYKNEELRQRAIKMADWECGIHLPNGGVLGGVIGESNLPVVFNTGQVIFGWCRAFSETQDKKYLLAAVKAAQFLMTIQDDDGAWRKHITIIHNASEAHAKEVRCACALLEVHKLTGAEKYKIAAIKNLEYTLTLQLENGWFMNNCLRGKYFDIPLLHSIAYTMEGILEVGVYLNNEGYIGKAQKITDALVKLQKEDGSLAGRFDCNWRPAVKYCCLTGLAQTAGVWLKFYQITGDAEYLVAAQKANRFLKSTQNLRSKNKGIRGGIEGSYPIYGRYGQYQYLNWAVKFFIDALLLEEQCTEIKP